MSNQDRQTIQRLKGRIAYLQEELANVKAELLDDKENNQHQKEVARLESENMVLKELLSKYKDLDFDQYEALVEENKQLKKRLEKQSNHETDPNPVANKEDSWFMNNLKSQSSSQLNPKNQKR